MSQNQQPCRPSDHLHDPIKYRDVFPVQGDLAGEPIYPRDAALMQTAESLGKTQKGGAASVMQFAATLNERAGLVSHDDFSGGPAIQGVTITDTDTPGRRIVSERVGGQTVGRFAVPTAEPSEKDDSDEKITMGETPEVTGLWQTVMSAGSGRRRQNWVRRRSQQRRK